MPLSPFLLSVLTVNNAAGQAALAKAAEAEARQREDAERWRKRVAEVEHELRCLLAATERQKKASRAKMAQLARAVYELQAPLPAWQLV